MNLTDGGRKEGQRPLDCFLPLWARPWPARVWHGGCMRVACHLCEEGPCQGSALRSTSARSVSVMCFLLLLSTPTRVFRATHSHALPVLSVMLLASSGCCLTPPLPHAPQCTSSQESARRRSLLATAIMSVWLWSIAVTGGLTAGTCLMSSIVVRSCWGLQRAPGGLPRAGLHPRLI